MTSTQRNNQDFQRFGLRYNPFPPAATGAPMGGVDRIPGAWAQELTEQFNDCIQTDTPRLMVITGPPGSGKTTILRWMTDNLYHPAGIVTHIISNPTLNLHRMIDQVIDQTGSYELSKGMWELLKPDIPGAQGDLSAWIDGVQERRQTREATESAKQALLKQEITRSPEVADLFANVLLETKNRPYYRSRSLDPTNTWQASKLAESFKTLIKLLQRMPGATGVAFLIDDFTDITLQNRLIRKQIRDYQMTLNVLRKTTQSGDFWLAMARNKRENDPSPERCKGEAQKEFNVPPLTTQNAYDMVYHLLKKARTPDNPGGIWPFTKNAILSMNPPNRERPKPLIKTFSRALAMAVEKGEEPPISNWLVWESQEKIRPGEGENEEPVEESETSSQE